jgi:hypothetical protein
MAIVRAIGSGSGSGSSTAAGSSAAGLDGSSAAGAAGASCAGVGVVLPQAQSDSSITSASSRGSKRFMGARFVKVFFICIQKRIMK